MIGTSVLVIDHSKLQDVAIEVALGVADEEEREVPADWGHAPTKEVTVRNMPYLEQERIRASCPQDITVSLASVEDFVSGTTTEVLYDVNERQIRIDRDRGAGFTTSAWVREVDASRILHTVFVLSRAGGLVGAYTRHEDARAGMENDLLLMEHLVPEEEYTIREVPLRVG